jgi:uncharacterized protein
VFGSHARGTALSVVMSTFWSSSDTFDNYMELKFYLQRVLKRRVDLVVIDALRPELRASIL